MTGAVAIIGIGQTRFGRHEASTGLDLGAAAIGEALTDAGISWTDVDVAAGGSDASGNADTLVARLGLTGIPFTNVHNGCATGGVALLTTCDAIRSGRASVGVAVGFDKHPRGAFSPAPADWGLDDRYGETGMMLTTQFFGMKIRRYLHDHGVGHETLALVAAKAYRNGARNPLAWRRDEHSVDAILAAPMLADPLTQLMFCSPGAGGAAVVITDRADLIAACRRPIFLAGLAARTRRYGSFEVFSPSLSPVRAPSPTEEAAAAAFEAAGVAPADVDVAQLQDTESGAEVMHLAEVGLCAHGEQDRLLADGETEIGGRLPVNTDGGCIANGEPIGASGLRQVCETVRQLRGRAGANQVPGDPRVGFTQVYGAPGVSACTVLIR